LVFPRIRKFPFITISILLLALALPVFAADEGAKITDIQIAGNKKVEADTIRSKMSIKVGDPFIPSKVRQDIENIYRMGYFSDVKVDAEGYQGGLRLTFNVVERPILASFNFEGNEKLESTKLREKVNLTAYSIYNPSLVEENAEKLRLFYQDEGYYNAQVLPLIKETKRDVRVIYQIKEGDKVRISKVTFVGNEKISTKKIKKVISTKKYIPLWSWVMKTGTYKVVDFSQDIERIKGLYYNNGYIQVNVGEPKVELSADKKSLSITIPIHEGDQFRYGTIDVSGNKVFTAKELMEKVKSKPGEIMNRDLMKDDVVALTDMYGSKGYAFASISPVIKPNTEKKLVDVTLEISEGDQIFVNRINISGNIKTRDKIIRRELKFDEGQIYDTTSLKTSYDRLKNLDFFEDVQIVPERKAEKDTVDLNVKVKEKSTGSFSIGGGYSTIDRLVGIGEITQNNFLGLGEMLKFKGEFGARTQNFNLSFLEPWLLDRPVSLRIDLFKEERTYTGYAEKSTGASLSLGRRFWDYWGITGTYSWSDERYFDVVDTISTDPLFVQSQEFKTTGKIGVNFYRDSRDNYLDPRRGSNNSIYTEYAATALGGDNAFYKVIGDSTWYFPFFLDTAFSIHGRIGYAAGLQGRPLPLNERFFVGGMGTVRGLDWGTAGPRFPISKLDKITGATVITSAIGDPKGGSKELVFNGEYTFPLFAAVKLRGVTFVDAGRAFDDGEGYDLSKLTYTAGAGLRWTSPMGLIRLEYGYVLNRKQDERSGKFEFSMGSMF
jgi:outer membrane protein insertion porin family